MEGLEGTQSFQVTIPNRPPVIANELAPQTMFLGDSVAVDVSEGFSDPDGDDLTFEAISSDTSVAVTTVSNSEVAVRAVARGGASVTVTASDPDGGEASQDFEVRVPNRAPVVETQIPSDTVFLGETVTVDVSASFSDPDGDPLTFEAFSSDTAVVRASSSGSEIALEGLGRGAATVSVVASDGEGGEARASFGVTVPNRKPVATGTIPAQTVNEGETTTVNVASYFRDPDGDALDFGASSSDAAVASVSASGSQVTIEGVTPGPASVTVSARDPDGGEAFQSFSVTVRLPPPPNQKPVVTSAIPAQTVRENENVSVDLDGHFSDPEGGALNYGATSSDGGVATAEISGSDVVVGGVNEGTATVTVTATDPGGLSADHEFGVTVEPASTNQAPQVTGTIADRTAIIGGELPVQAYRYFTDPDGDDANLDYTVGTSNTAVATVRQTSEAVFRVTAVSNGSAAITVTAEDPGGLTASVSFTFTVGNNAPRVKAAAPAVTSSPGEVDTLVFTSHFEETDVGDALLYGASSTNSGVASASVKFDPISGDIVEITGVSAGEATINMTATDRGGLSATTSSLVTVNANLPPQVTQSIGNQSLAVNDTLTWDLSQHFSDPDNDALTYTAAGGFAVTVSVSDATFQLVGATRGVSPVRVTATDPSGREAEITFLAFVSNAQSLDDLAAMVGPTMYSSSCPPRVS